MSRIDLGLIDGNYWNAAHVDMVEAAINESSPAGEVVMTIAATAPTGWLMLNGQVVPNAQSLFPDLWAVAPLAWKSGASLTLPNAAQRFPIGGPVGTVGGSSSRTIAAANLPVHTHTYSGTSTDAVDHVHGGSGAHNHATLGGLPANVQLVSTGDPFPGTSPAGINATGSGYMVLPATPTGPSGQLHQHDYSGTTSPVGSGTAVDVTPAWIAFNFMIRSY